MGEGQEGRWSGCQMGSLEAHFFFLFMGLALGFFFSMTCSGPTVLILYSIFFFFFSGVA